MPKRYYIVTPIYYVNATPHIGTGLTTFVADVTKRYHKMRGEDPFFLTGTDENGLKIYEAAQSAGKDPQQFVDEISQIFRDVWQGMKIEYDRFIRTTGEDHTKAAQRVFEILREKGYLYEDTYKGWYDVSSETFYKESELVDGKSPDGNEVRWVEERNLFFKLEEFGPRLKKHIEDNPEFIQPVSRRNEVLSFIDQGLRNVCVTRKNPGWGIPVPGDEELVIYVWFEALINYIAGAGWPDGDWQSLWPADVQWLGKDILTRFHATLWPAILMGLDLPLPKTLATHAWILIGGEKISKSKQNVVLPLVLAEETAQISGCSTDIAVDAVRHYLAANMPYETDSTFSYEDYYQRFNSDLANDLGNALNRSLSMAHKFIGDTVPTAEIEPPIQQAIDKAKADYEEAMEQFRVDRATESALGLVRFLNKYIDDRAPWKLAKSGDPALGGVIASMLLALRTSEALFRPIMPSAADAIAEQLGQSPLTNWSEVGSPDSMKAGAKMQTPQPIFPRIDLAAALPPQPESNEQPKPEGKKQETAKSEPEAKPKIDFEQFMNVELKVARIIEAEPVPKSSKLMKLKVQIGPEDRQIIAGIAKAYSPEDLIGRQVVVVANLKTAKLMGLESQGMVLAADDEDGSPILLQPDKEAPEGTSVH